MSGSASSICPRSVTPWWRQPILLAFRFHGSAGLYWGSYSDEELASWAGRLADSTKNLKAVYIYFNNDAEAFAVSNAMILRVYLETEETE